KGAPGHRYWQKPDTPPQEYLPKVTGTDWNIIAADSGVKVGVSEGESKSFVLTCAGRPTIGIGGVWLAESLRNGQFLLPGLAAFNWNGRIVEIIFDSDARVKAGVQAAQAALMRELSNRGARPSSVLLPEDSKGADDFLKLHTIEE